jgi:hypothetical protein
MEEKENIADMLREAVKNVKKAFNEGDTDQTKMVVLPAQQVIDICVENDKLKGINEKLLCDNVAYKDHIEKMGLFLEEANARIDELGKKIIARESVFNNLVIVEKDKSVKHTAKEILILAEDYNCGYEYNMDDFMLALKERYGVEVE